MPVNCGCEGGCGRHLWHPQPSAQTRIETVLAGCKCAHAPAACMRAQTLLQAAVEQTAMLCRRAGCSTHTTHTCSSVQGHAAVVYNARAWAACTAGVHSEGAESTPAIAGRPLRCTSKGGSRARDEEGGCTAASAAGVAVSPDAVGRHTRMRDAHTKLCQRHKTEASTHTAGSAARRPGSWPNTAGAVVKR
jgi:hypothetical protein